jgi:Uma2 family endonuclease
VPEEYQGLLPTDEDWQRLLESALPEDDDNWSIGYESDQVAAEIIAQLCNWVRPRRLGRVTASNAGFILPNANEEVRAPDAST